MSTNTETVREIQAEFTNLQNEKKTLEGNHEMMFRDRRKRGFRNNDITKKLKRYGIIYRHALQVYARHREGGIRSAAKSLICLIVSLDEKILLDENHGITNIKHQYTKILPFLPLAHKPQPPEENLLAPQQVQQCAEAEERPEGDAQAAQVVAVHQGGGQGEG